MNFLRRFTFRRTLIRLGLTSAAGMSLLLAPVTAAAAPISQQNFDYTLTSIAGDICENNEPVAVTETLHFAVLVNSDGAGGFHVNSNVNVKNGTGTNLVTGASYIATGSNATAFEAKPPFPMVISNEATSVLVSQGAGPNLYSKILIHYTFNADGTLTASIFSFSFSCKG